MKQDDAAKILGILAAMQDQFASMQRRFDGLEGRFDGLEKRFDDLESEMREGFEQVGQQIDAIMGVYEKDDTERVALSAQVDRHDTWIKKAAPKLNVKYSDS